ncbi:MAG: ferredoxin FdxA [Pseudomonadota bacterium]
MTFVITDACVKCKFTDCVDVCPVDCFHEGEMMLVINPDICIDCGVCEAECPVDAIKPESADLLVWVERGRELSRKWPVITSSKKPLTDADMHRDEEEKFEKYIIPNSIFK